MPPAEHDEDKKTGRLVAVKLDETSIGRAKPKRLCPVIWEWSMTFSQTGPQPLRIVP